MSSVNVEDFGCIPMGKKKRDSLDTTDRVTGTWPFPWASSYYVNMGRIFSQNKLNHYQYYDMDG